MSVKEFRLEHATECQKFHEAVTNERVGGGQRSLEIAINRLDVSKYDVGSNDHEFPSCAIGLISGCYRLVRLVAAECVAAGGLTGVIRFSNDRGFDVKENNERRRDGVDGRN